MMGAERENHKCKLGDQEYSFAGHLKGQEESQKTPTTKKS